MVSVFLAYNNAMQIYHHEDDRPETMPTLSWLERLEHTRTGRLLRRYWLTVAFVLGFLTDVWLLDRVDDVLDNIILFFYVSLAFISMTVLYVGVAERASELWSQRFRVFAPLLIQYSFGGLLSGMFIFYGRSGDWLVSWPLLLFFAVIMVANEVVRDRASRLVYHLAVLFIGLFAYLVLVIPVLVGVMGPLMFVLSGTLALVVMYVFIQILAMIIPHFMRLQMRLIVFMVGSIFVAYNALYFTNVIPPIPLSITQMGIYHQVERTADGVYRLTYEPSAWWEVWRTTTSVFHPEPGGAVYCFSSVYAPTRITTDIQHRWEYRAADGRWIEHARIDYPIRAVGERGYRGYTLVQNYRNGRWRCSVETTRGQVLGRQYFTIDTSTAPSQLRQRVD